MDQKQTGERQPMTSHTRLPLGSLPTNSPSKKRQKLTGAASSTSITKPQHSRSTASNAAISNLKNIIQQNKKSQNISHSEHQGKQSTEQLPTLQPLNDEDIRRHNQREQERRLLQQQKKQQLQQERIKAANEELDHWRVTWREIISEAQIFFQTEVETPQEEAKRKRLSKLFLRTGATVCRFFSKDVTIVITNTQKQNLPSNMLNLNSSVKIWDYVKATRFLAHLGVLDFQEQEDASLNDLIQKEKIHGPADRDPNAKKSDFHYFKYPYFLVYDARQVIKPVAVREWKTTERDPKPWPHAHRSTCGHSLFQEDSTSSHSDGKKERRRLRFEANKSYREQLREVYERRSSSRYNSSSQPPTSSPRPSSKAHSSDAHVNDLEEERYQEPPEETQQQEIETQVTPEIEHCFQTPALPPHLDNGLKLPRQDTIIASNQYAGDGLLQASGFNASNAVSQQAADFQSKNGLAPSMTSNPSKAVHSLQRQVLEDNTKKKQSSSKKLSSKSKAKEEKKEKVPGYCENCKVGFDDFDEHILIQVHRDFATNDSNFEQIDLLIDELQKCINNKC
ncbi:hypothetical protein WICPIJ_008156 [Wickerhamomyces pijperi]|uniref:DBF4-type domain-containing protein n=1 Tax=Wickerhamomyces pijperi TaxID=599730 RepID=A0A9P8PYW7_WICPI|nr:hypothetical protein WICPIJ_008156 [Wickerhamomyces pijperi]